MNIYGGSAADMQHDLGIVAEYARLTGLKLNGSKSAYLANEVSEGVMPEGRVTMGAKWHGSCDGY